MLLQSVIEKSGIPTVSVSTLMEVTRRVDAPRVLAVDHPLGFPLGEASNAELQRAIMMAALTLVAQPAPIEKEFHA